MTPAERFRDRTTDARLAKPKDWQHLTQQWTAGVTAEEGMWMNWGNGPLTMTVNEALRFADWIIKNFRTEIPE